MDIDPRQLKHLLAIARAGSFGRAAELMNVSQPALSLSISRLEDVVGVKLLERGRHGAVLNEAGAVLARHAEGVEVLLRKADVELRNQTAGILGPLSIGGTPLAASSIIPAVVARLSQEAHPVSVEIVEGVDEDLMDMLRRHEIDVAISTIGMSPRASDVEEIPLFQARAVVVVRKGHRLAQAEAISLHDVIDELWVLPPQGGKLRSQIEALFVTSGLPFPSNLVQVSVFGVIKEVIRRTDGLTILSDQIVSSELADGSLVAMPLVEPVAIRSFGLQTVAGRALSPLVARFRMLAIEMAPKFDLPG